MPTSIFDLLRHEYQEHRLAWFAAWVLAYGAALVLVGFVKGSVPGSLKLLFWIAFIPTTIFYVFRLTTAFGQHVLWSLRRRLIVTYIFIARVPILLILGLVSIGAIVINGQFAAYLVAARLKDYSDELEQLNRVVVHEAHLGRYRNPTELLDHLGTLYVTELSQHASSYPNLEITVRVASLER